VVGQPALRRGIGPGVVVDDDDERQVLLGGDVVDRLPRHAAGQRAVTDHRDRMPVGSPRRRRALAIPSAHDKAVEAWEFSTTSWDDSARLG
jgi:hypothetical protein